MSRTVETVDPVEMVEGKVPDSKWMLKAGGATLSRRTALGK
jgi:hypothetical protein